MGQSNETKGCDSEGNKFVKNNVKLVSAIGYHRIEMERVFYAVLTEMVS